MIKRESLTLKDIASRLGCSRSVVSMRLDHNPGIQQAARHLAELGHKNVLWTGFLLNGEPEEPQRKETINTCVREAGMRLSNLFLQRELLKDMQSIRGYIAGCTEQFRAHFERSKPPTAIIAYNEILGIAVNAALTELGYRVPRDVSVIGYDNIYAELSTPAMTVVSGELREAGRRTAMMLLHSIENPKPRKKLGGNVEWIPTRLVVRDSTATARLTND